MGPVERLGRVARGDAVSAVAIARVRKLVNEAGYTGFSGLVTAADLRALLDAHTALEAKLEEERERYESTFITPADDAVAKADALLTEALDALVGLEDACASVASWSEECLDYSDSRRIAARTVLAKAGRR